MKYIVSGCAGFLGSSVVEALLFSGHEVVGVDSFSSDYSLMLKRRNLEVSLSYSRFRLIEMPISELQPDELTAGAAAFIHFARHIGEPVESLVKAIGGLREQGDLRRVVLASSCSVYGVGSQAGFTEDSPIAPFDDEGRYKATEESVLEQFAGESGVELTTLRYFTIYGPRQRPDMGIHRLMKAGLQGEEFVLQGGLKQTRDYLFIDDAVQATLKSLQAEPATFNIGSGRPVSLKEIIFSVENIIGRKIRIVGPAAGDSVIDVQADISRARSLLSFQPKVTLDQGLEAEARWIDQMLREGVL